MNIFVIFPLIVLAIIALVLRLVHKSWLAPGAFFPLSWFIFSLAPIIFASEYPLPVFGLWIIAAICTSLGLGSLFAFTMNTNMFPNNQYKIDEIFKYSEIIKYGTIFTSIMSFIGIILMLLYTFSRFNLNFTLVNFLILPNQISSDRYNELLVLPAYLKFFIYWVYPAALFGGIGFGIAKTKKELFLFLIPLFISVMKGTIETVRTTILSAVVVWLAGYIGSRVAANDNLKKLIDKKMFIFLSVAGSVFIILFVALDWLRIAGGEMFANLIIERIKLYFFGYLSAFTTWVTYSYNVNYTLGMSTFAGPFDLLGLIERKLGFYNHTFIHGVYYTNVYSALRGLLNDFSLFGTLFMGLGVGFFSTVAFNKTVNNHFFWIFPLTAFYAFTLYSPIISIFIYNSVLIAWVIVFTCLFLFQRNKRNGNSVISINSG